MKMPMNLLQKPIYGILLKQLNTILPPRSYNYRRHDDKPVRRLAMEPIVPQNVTQCAFNFDAPSDQPLDLQNVSQKQCKNCNQFFPATAEFFVTQREGRGGLRNTCKKCRQEKRRKTERLPEGHKRCSKCKTLSPSTTEFFYVQKSHGDGLTSHCKQCISPPKQNTIPEGQKQCSKCKEIYLATAEYFQHDKRGRGGLRAFCKQCICAEYESKHPNAKPRYEVPEGMKRCSTCGELKPPSEFFQDKNKRDGYRYDCKSCKKKYDNANRETIKERHAIWHKQYYATNTEKLKRKRKNYYTANGEVMRERSRYYYNVNREEEKKKKRDFYNNVKINPTKMDKIRESNRIASQKYKKKGIHKKRMESDALYRERFCLLARSRRSLRRARMYQNGYEKVDYREILERDGYICHICGGTVDPEQLHYDHVIPIARGGSHTKENIKVSHAVCNMRKSSKLLEEIRPFYKDVGGHK